MDKKKYTVYRSPKDGLLHITRNRPPTFTGRYIDGRLEIDPSSLREPLDPVWLEKRMRGIHYKVKGFEKLEEKIRIWKEQEKARNL